MSDAAPANPVTQEPPLNGPAVEVKPASFDKETGVVDLGGVHLYYARIEEALQDAGLGDMGAMLGSKPKSELAFGEINDRGQQAPGGAVLYLSIPRNGFSEETVKKITKFMEDIDAFKKRIAHLAPPKIVVYENGEDVRRQTKIVVVSDKDTIEGIAGMAKKYGKNHRVGSANDKGDRELEMNGNDFAAVVAELPGTTPFFNLERAINRAARNHQSQADYRAMRGGRGYSN